MGVAIDDDVGVVASSEFLRGRTSNLVAVAEVYSKSVEQQIDLLGESRIARRIGIPEHGPDRRDQSQLLENLGSTHITRVKYQLDPLQRIVHTWTNEPVRIRDEPYEVNAGVWHSRFYILGV